MKKLNLLAPIIHDGYLGGRGREWIRYMDIPGNLGRKQLEEDQKNGATFLDAILKQTEKKPVHTVVIRAKNEEIGLMAVSYLAGVYNEYEAEQKCGCLSDVLNHDECGILQDEPDPDEEEGIWDADIDASQDECAQWVESPWHLPVIQMGEIHILDQNNNRDIFGMGMFGMQGEQQTKQRDPWWFACKEQPVCILCNGACFPNDYRNYSTTAGAFFRKNRHVYLLEIVKPVEESLFFEDAEDEDALRCKENPDFTRMVLEEAAAVVELSDDLDEEMSEYRQIQFQNWVDREGFTLSETFSLKKIIGRINQMKNDSKSELMRQILHYIRVQEEEITVLGDEDFDILKRFARMNEKGEDLKSSIRTLEKELYGMEKVKERVKETVDVLKYHKRRESLGIKRGNYHNVHLFIGAPGTAKTTVARLMGNMMCEQNLLPGNRFSCVNGADLKGMYVGHTAPKVKRLFEENDIIMIDEAYSMAAYDGFDTAGDTFSQEAVATLVTLLEDYGTEKLVLFAGYGGMDVSEKDNLMKRFIDSNPGLRSRINSTLYFESYTPEQMVEIVHIQARNNEFTISRKADDIILEFFKERVKDRNFGNGREARRLLETAAVFAAKRTSHLKNCKNLSDRLKRLYTSDIKRAVERMKLENATQNGRTDAKICGFIA